MNSPVPTAWASADVGSVGQSGSAQFEPGGPQWMVKGAGADIWGSRDAFHFLYRALDGDGEVGAQVVSLQNTHTFAKAGVMIRESLAENSKHVLIDVRPNGSWELLVRRETGGLTTAIGGTGANTPRLLSLKRVGDQVQAFVSFSEGEAFEWTLVGTVTLALEPTVYVGAVVTSHNSATVNTSTFDNLYVTKSFDVGAPPPAPWTSRDIGNTGQSGGGYNPDFDTFYFAGAGADIWSSADAFRYVNQSVAGDIDVVARVTGIENTHPFAKAGLMIRDELTPDSPHVLLDVNPNGGIELLTRQAKGGQTTFVAGAGASLPVWLRLRRSGTLVTGAISVDGVSWSTVGSVSASPIGPTRIKTAAYAGMAITSHDPSRLNAARFENVGISAGVQPNAIGNIVLYARDLATAHGQMGLVIGSSLSTSPDNAAVESPDAGFAALSAPVASPEHFADFVFNADAGIAYTLWLRLRARDDSKWNDSVWVQFSDALANGRSIHEIGRPSGLLVNLATDSGASSLNGWGWGNRAYWLSQPTTLSFGSTGPHRIRIQVREDGFWIDQIVLSSRQYLTAPPGPPTNDNTIVPKQ
jgi:hypothetical protein